MMDGKQSNPIPVETGTQEASYVPASIYKRVWAWVAVVYMLIITCLVTYFIATWRFLTGLTGIMLFPALGGFAVVKGIQASRLDYAADRVGPIFWCILSGLLCLLSLGWGLQQLLQLFMG